MESQYSFDLHFPDAKEVEHLKMYLLTICTSLENCLFSTFVHLLIRLFVPLVFNYLNFKIFWILINFWMKIFPIL
jgi:hypothetical protein